MLRQVRRNDFLITILDGRAVGSRCCFCLTIGGYRELPTRRSAWRMRSALPRESPFAESPCPLLPAILWPVRQMGRVGTSVLAVLDRLESHYGPQVASWPTEPYEFLLWWHCGYPASDAACARGWESLKKQIGTDPRAILTVSNKELTRALKPGGMVPEVRAMRSKEIAARVQDEFAGDLRQALAGPLAQVRKALKKFPGIADAGADRILLFGGISAVAAVPSNVPYVLVRIRHGRERESYTVTYKEAQQAILMDVAETFDARTRAYLLLKRHGQEICKRVKPECHRCPVNSVCAFRAGKQRGRTPTQ
jgi:endonuclease III related protein